MGERLKEIDREIAALQAERESVAARFGKPWPKRLTAYVHGDRLTMSNSGEELGLTGAALSLFSHALSEVEVTIAVQERGDFEILEVKYGAQILRPVVLP